MCMTTHYCVPGMHSVSGAPVNCCPRVLLITGPNFKEQPIDIGHDHCSPLTTVYVIYSEYCSSLDLPQ